MDTQAILAEIDAEIARLQKARAILSSLPGSTATRSPGRPKADKSTPAVRKTRVMSAEARAKIAEAQNKRWSKQKTS